MSYSRYAALEAAAKRGYTGRTTVSKPKPKPKTTYNPGGSTTKSDVNAQIKKNRELVRSGNLSKAAKQSLMKQNVKLIQSQPSYSSKPKPKPKPTPNVRQAVAADKKKSQSTVRAKTQTNPGMSKPDEKFMLKAQAQQDLKRMKEDPKGFTDELATNLVAGVPPVGPGLALKGASAIAKGLSAASKSKGTPSLGKATPKAKEAGASGLGTAVSRSQMNSLAKQEAAMVSRTAPSRAPSPSRPSQTPQPAKTPTPARQPSAPTSAKPSRSPWDLPSPAKAPKAPFRGPVAEPEVPLRDKPEEDQPPQEFAPTPTTDAPVVPELDFTPTPTPRDTPEVSNNIGTRPDDKTKTDKVTKTDPGKGNQPKPPKTRTVVSSPRSRRPLDSGTPGEPNPEPFRRSTIGQEVGLAGRQPSSGSVTRSFMSSPDDNEGVQATRPLPGRSRNNELSEGAGGLGPEERAAMLRQRRRTVSED